MFLILWLKRPQALLCTIPTIILCGVQNTAKSGVMSCVVHTTGHVSTEIIARYTHEQEGDSSTG